VVPNDNGRGRLFQRMMLVFILMFAWSAGSPAATYDYPFVNAYEATVIGTPSFYQPDLPEEIPVETYSLTVFPERKIPDVFWYTDGLRFSLVRQDREAPLIFLIAGTGANYNAGNSRLLQKAFHQAGFHVLSLTSPTHPNFVIHASSTSVPGHPLEDARDLYRVMQLAYATVRDTIAVSRFHVAGYSLGAAHAAFIAWLDAGQKAFDLQRVLMINPPVSIYNSVEILDRLLSDNLDVSDPREVNQLIDRIMTTFIQTYEQSQALDFTGDFLYEIYKTRPPKEENLEILIGVSFRFSSRNLIFAADVMNRAGYVVPANRELSATDSLTPYFIVLGQTMFTDYYREFFLPFYQARYPGISDLELRGQMSLKSIAPFLRQNPNIGLLGNADDIILAPGELAYLEELFGDRATIYPTGGHCGNMAHAAVLAAIVGYFTNP
jgi:pimeloyl-ACP methyl ester carboxylesterase